MLSKTAFRYELGDPKTIKDFAEKVKTVEKLKLLFVLTVADIKGVGPEIWNDWKGSLISDLYIKSLNVLEKRISTKNVYEYIETAQELFKSNMLKYGFKNEVVEHYCKKTGCKASGLFKAISNF